MAANRRFVPTTLPAALVVAGVLSLGALRAKAELISITSFSFASNGDNVSITPFNAVLGTLDSVNVSISGTFDVLTQPPPNIGPGGPMPYSFSIAASQSFTSLFAGRGFDTVVAASFIRPGNLASGIGGAQSVVIPFDDSFTLTAVTDLAGMTATTAGGFVSGQRSGFLPSISPPGLPIDEVITESALFAGGDLPVPVIDVFAVGAGFITYAYRPVTALAEPTSLATFGLGLLACTLLRRRRVA